MELVFVTTNPGKFRSMKNVLSDYPDVKLVQEEMEYPENHDSNSTEEIAREGAKFCAGKLDKPVVVTDGGLFIKALNGFPGVNTGFMLKTIGNEGLLKLMEGREDREAVFRISLGYATPEGETKCFTGEMDAIITNEKRGEKGFGFDHVFQPEGFEETFAENPEVRDKQGPLVSAFEQFSSWIEEN